MDDKIVSMQAEIDALKKVISSMDRTAMILIQRDLELRRANKKLSELDKNKSEFVSVAAHQMRTPLSAIRWSQQMLINQEVGPLSESQMQIVNQTLQSVTGLITLVNNLLTAEQLEIGKGNDTIQRIDLTKLVYEVIDVIRPTTIHKNVVIEFLYPDEPVTIDSNAERMKNVFQNLIENAVKYSGQNGKVTVSLKFDALGSVAAVIADSGIGIPEAYKSRVFGRFERADNAKRVDPNGSGLGLYIVKKIIEGSGGTITFDSTVGVGTTFYITLPKSQT